MLLGFLLSLLLSDLILPQLNIVEQVLTDLLHVHAGRALFLEDLRLDGRRGLNLLRRLVLVWIDV